MSVHRDDLGIGIFSFEDLSTSKYPRRMSFESGLQVELKNRTITSKITKIGKLLYGFSFRLLDYSRFEALPPLIFVCIGFNFNSTSKEK